MNIFNYFVQNNSDIESSEIDETDSSVNSVTFRGFFRENRIMSERMQMPVKRGVISTFGSFPGIVEFNHVQFQLCLFLIRFFLC